MKDKKHKLVIIGYGGHAKSVIDSILSPGQYEIIGYTDVEDKGSEIVKYLGTDDELRGIFDTGVSLAFFGLGYMGRICVRSYIYEILKSIGYSFPIIIDPSAIVARDAIIGEGTFIGKRAVVNAGSIIGKNCIINTGSIIEHENSIGDYTHVAVGATLCGNITVGSQCLIGANATVLQGLSIGNNAIIGAGSVVLSNVGEGTTVVGNPAKEKRK